MVNTYIRMYTIVYLLIKRKYQIRTVNQNKAFCGKDFDSFSVRKKRLNNKLQLTGISNENGNFGP